MQLLPGHSGTDSADVKRFRFGRELLGGFKKYKECVDMKELKRGQVLVLNRREIKDLVSEEEVVQLVEQVLEDYSNGDVINPIKGHMPFYPQHNSYLNAMPSWLKNRGVCGIKWAGQGEDNPAKYGFPQCTASIILNDPETALPYAFIEGTDIMSLRTGAAAAIMARHCARKDSKTATIIGAGVQGTSGFHMLMITMPQIREIRVVDIRQQAIDRFVEDGQKLYPQVKFQGFTDIQQAVNGTDIVITAAHSADSSGEGILDNIVFPKGLTLVTISGGLSIYKVRERCDRSVLDFIDCYVFRMNATRGYMKEMYGIDRPELTAAVADAEIGDVIAGKVPGRLNDDQIVFAAGIGMSIEDLVVADVVFRRAREKDLGTVVDFLN